MGENGVKGIRIVIANAIMKATQHIPAIPQRGPHSIFVIKNFIITECQPTIRLLIKRRKLCRYRQEIKSSEGGRDGDGDGGQGWEEGLARVEFLIRMPRESGVENLFSPLKHVHSLFIIYFLAVLLADALRPFFDLSLAFPYPYPKSLTN